MRGHVGLKLKYPNYDNIYAKEQSKIKIQKKTLRIFIARTMDQDGLNPSKLPYCKRNDKLFQEIRLIGTDNIYY